ncbi:hypothetical protein ACOSQ4_020935 [Xanthoceras sorbifolium]
MCLLLDCAPVMENKGWKPIFEELVPINENKHEEVLELKPLHEGLKFAFLGEEQTYPVGHPYYCFLDGYSSYYQIFMAHEVQERTTFICPLGTFVFRRMLFDLCNNPTTFQTCMLFCASLRKSHSKPTSFLVNA